MLIYIFILLGGKKWVPLEIGPPPSGNKLRGKVVGRSNSDYYVASELMNGTNGYGDDYKSKYGSNIPRNRSQRGGERRIRGEMVDRGYGKAPLAYPNVQNVVPAKTGLPPTALAQETDPSKKAIPSVTSPVSPGSQASLGTTVNPAGMPYARRNTGLRGGGRGGVRGGILPPRTLNRSRSQTGVDGIVSVSGVSTGATLTNPGVSNANSAQSEEFASDVGFYYDYAPAASVDVTNLPITSTATTPTFMAPSYFYNTPYITYDAERLRELLRSQIEYYFSEENLQRDFFLRRKMDEGGFLPISLIASFHRVQALTSDVSLVVEALTNSTTVEIVDGVKLRTRHNPDKWPLVSLNCCFDRVSRYTYFFVFVLSWIMLVLLPQS